MINLEFQMDKLRVGLGAILVAALSACGGGGGGSASAPVELNGVAAKGLIKNGMVKAYVVTNGVVSTTAVDSAETNTSGEYKLTKVPADALIKLEVVPIEGKTKVVDETDGSEYSPTSDFKLSAVLSVVPGAANEAHITPATEMVVKRAEALGGFTPSNTAYAAGEIQATLGFSPNEKPAFAADGFTPASKAAVYLKTVALVAKDSTTASNLGCTDSTNAARVACVTKAMATKAAAGGTAFAAVTTALTSKQTEAKVGVSDSVKNEVVAPVAIKAPTEVTVPTNLPTTAIAKAKQFFVTLKSSLALLSSDDPTATTFQTEFDKVATEFKNSTNPANDHALNAADFMLSAAGTFKKSKDDGVFQVAPTIWKNNLQYSCAWFKDISAWKIGGTAATNAAADANILSCRYGEVVVTNPSDTTKRFWGGIQVLITANPSNTNSVYAYSMYREEAQYFDGSKWLTAPLAANSTSPLYLYTVPSFSAKFEDLTLEGLNKAVITITKQETNAVAGNIEGFIATSVKRKSTFATTSQFKSLAEWAAAKDFPTEILGIKHGINLNIDATNENGRTTIKFSGFHSLYKKADVVHSKISLDSGSQITGTTDANNNFTPTGFDLSITLQGETSGFTGKLTASDFLKGPEADSKPEPTKIVLDGSLKLKTDELFKGTITFLNSSKGTFNPTQAVSASNFEKGSVEIVGDFKVPSKDPLQLKIKMGKEEFKKPLVSLSYSQKESPLITLKAYGDESDSTKEYMDLTFGADVTATIKNGDQSFDLKSNGATIATYKKSTGKIEYLDGSFEKF